MITISINGRMLDAIYALVTSMTAGPRDGASREARDGTRYSRGTSEKARRRKKAAPASMWPSRAPIATCRDQSRLKPSQTLPRPHQPIKPVRPHQSRLKHLPP